MFKKKLPVFLKTETTKKAFNFFSLLLQSKPIVFMFYCISELFHKTGTQRRPPSPYREELMGQQHLSATSFCLFFFWGATSFNGEEK